MQDVVAPGLDVLAPVSATASSGKCAYCNVYFEHSEAFMSGTSMSSAQVAGIAALLKAAHPTWTPMMIKSAIMTSASDLVSATNGSYYLPMQHGAGHVEPASALNPGLVFDSSLEDWQRTLCASGQPRGYAEAKVGACGRAGERFKHGAAI